MVAAAEVSLPDKLAAKPYLLIDPAVGIAELADAAAMLEATLAGTMIVIHAARGLRAIEQLAAGQTEFSITDIAKIAGHDYHTVHFWLRENIIVASRRPAAGAGKGRGPIFGTGDAIACGIVGSLRRLGFPLEVLRLIAPVFAETKRSTDRAATRRQS